MSTQPVMPVQPESKAVLAARASLSRERRGIRALIPFLGPAFIASVAYVDPGNFATNIQSGSEFGYRLLWVVVVANLMAMLLQNMSAKLGIATGRSLPELCRAFFPKWLSYVMWSFSEVAAMATDIAEFLGATLALNLLFHIPMLVATLLTGVTTYLILMMDRLGFRPMEKFIGALVAVIAICYIVETIIAKPPFSQIAYHSVVPWLGGQDAIVLAVGIIGATVMPHAVYLHSSLTQSRVVPRNDRERKQIFRFNTIEVIIALTLAGLINLAMMFMAASVFHTTGHTQVADIPSAYRTLTPLLGPAAAGVFLVSLLSSGISSSVVGTMAGQVVMQGFVGFSIPLWLRRVLTMAPTVLIVWIGLDPTRTLIISQVVLSLVLPMPVIALIYFTRRRDLMGVLVNSRPVTLLSTVCAVVILVLNIGLLSQTIIGHLPV